MKVDSAIILAGGKGTRLQKILNGLPKPLVKINNKPLLDYQIDLLIKYGIFNIYILVNYKAEIIKNHLNYKYPNINFKILHDGDKPLGTGGSILFHLNLFPKYFFVLYGDTFLNVNLNEFKDFHFKLKSDLTLFVHPNSHPYDSDIVICDSDNKVINISAYPHNEKFYSSNLVNAALYVLNKNVLKSIDEFEKNNIIDFAKNIIPIYLKRNKNVYAYKSKEYIKDCGTVDRLKSVEEDYLSNKHNKLSLDSKSDLIFIDRDGTIIRNVDYLSSIDEVKFYKSSFKAINRFNKNGYIIAMVTNQPVIARGELKENDLQFIHNYIEWKIGENGGYLDELAYCPHHPDSGFEGELKHLKINCDCRKPKIGMLEKIGDTHRINKISSWIIGDSTADIKCGNDYGIKSVLVDTGFGGRDMKYYCQPDYTFRDIDQASKFIVSEHKLLSQKILKLKLNQNSKNIFISGLSMSGKSTISSVLKEKIISDDKSRCYIICLDDYLLPKSKRKKFPSIFNLEEIYRILDLRKKNKTICINPRRYNKFSQESKIYIDQKITIQPNDYIIFEGLIFGTISNKYFKENQFYIDAKKNVLYKRFFSDYLKRGLSKDKIINLYKSRIEERKIIEQQKKYLKILKI